jgi:CBS domain-containing protein
MVDSALIEQNYPIGIVTDSDFRSKGGDRKSSNVTFNRKIMKLLRFLSPKIFRLRKHQLVMLKHDVTHLYVTHDGTDKSK